MVMIALVVLLALLIIFVGRHARALLVARQARAVSPAPVVPKRGGDVEARRSARVFATLLLGVLMGVVWLVGHSKDRAKGRDAYLQGRAEYFDRVVSKSPIVPAVLAGVLATGMTVGAYELLAWGMALAFRSPKRSTPA